MLDTSTLESNKKIKDRISHKLNGINDQSRNYIKDIVTLINKEIGVNKVISILLFGSQRPKKRKEVTTVSDCDLLVIFKDRVSNHHIREIVKYFLTLEIKHHFREFSNQFSKKVLGVINQTTGIFMSHFLTKKKYWEDAIFHKIFRVNKVFSSIFAPRKIVIGNVLINSSILYGEDLREDIRPNIQITFQEMLRSTVMNLMISLFSLAISFLKNLNPTKYQLEAIKWALKASNYYCYRDSENLKNITRRFISFETQRSQKMKDDRAAHQITAIARLGMLRSRRSQFLAQRPMSLAP